MADKRPPLTNKANKTGTNSQMSQRRFRSVGIGLRRAADTAFDCKCVCISAQMAALSERAAVVFSLRFTADYGTVTVETDPRVCLLSARGGNYLGSKN